MLGPGPSHPQPHISTPLYDRRNVDNYSTFTTILLIFVWYLDPLTGIKRFNAFEIYKKPNVADSHKELILV